MQTTSLSCLGTSATSQGERARGMLSSAHLLSRKTCKCKRICQLCIEVLAFITQVVFFFCAWACFLDLFLNSLWGKSIGFFSDLSDFSFAL